MRALSGPEVRALLRRVVGGTPLLVWDGDRFHRVTPDALRRALGGQDVNDGRAKPRPSRADAAPEPEDQ